MSTSTQTVEVTRPVEPRSTRARSAAPPPASPSPAAKPDGWMLPLATLIVGMFITILDTSIVNIAIPSMRKEFGSTSSEIEWVATSYALCLGVVVPASAWLGARYGLKQTYLVTLAAFVATSALCGASWSLDSMIVFRVCQAIPGGIIPVICLTVLYRIVPPQKIPRAMSLYGLGVVVAPAIGPTLGGYLVEYINWRLIFYINVPIGIAGLVAALFALPRFSREQVRPFDLPGFLTVGTGLFALLLAITKGQDWGWTSYPILILLTTALLALALFVVLELELDAPLLDIRIFTNPTFLNSITQVAIISSGLFSAVFLIPQFLQDGQRMEAFDAGLLMLPQALILMIMMPIAGKLYDRIGARWPAVIGLLANSAGTLLITQITPSMTHTELIYWTTIRAFGIGLSLMPAITCGLDALAADATSSGSAFNNIAQRVTGSISIAAFTAIATTSQKQLVADRSALIPATVLTTHQSTIPHDLSHLFFIYQQLEIQCLAGSYGNVFLIMGTIPAVGAVLALCLPRRKQSAPNTNTGALEI